MRARRNAFDFIVVCEGRCLNAIVSIVQVLHSTFATISFVIQIADQLENQPLWAASTNITHCSICTKIVKSTIHSN